MRDCFLWCFRRRTTPYEFLLLSEGRKATGQLTRNQRAHSWRARVTQERNRLASSGEKHMLLWCNKIPELYISAIQANPWCSMLYSLLNVVALHLADAGKNYQEETSDLSQKQKSKPYFNQVYHHCTTVGYTFGCRKQRLSKHTPFRSSEC